MCAKDSISYLRGLWPNIKSPIKFNLRTCRESKSRAPAISSWTGQASHIQEYCASYVCVYVLVCPCRSSYTIRDSHVRIRFIHSRTLSRRTRLCRKETSESRTKMPFCQMVLRFAVPMLQEAEKWVHKVQLAMLLVHVQQAARCKPAQQRALRQ